MNLFKRYGLNSNSQRKQMLSAQYCLGNTTLLKASKTTLNRVLTSILFLVNRYIYLGDFKMNLLKYENCKYSNDFLLSFQSYAFIPMIDKPTRVHRGSTTLRDNILANQICGSVLGGYVVSDISVHFSQFCLLSSLDLRLSRGKPFQSKYRDFSFFSDDAFLHDLKSNWLGQSN